MRTDARRNLGRILEAAEAEILEHGPDVSMTTIAEHAGVAVGTLYRHHPTKRALVEAVLVAFVTRIVDRAEQAAAAITLAGDAMTQIEKLLADFVEDAAANPGLKAAATALDATIVTVDQEERGLVALRQLVAAAQKDGDLRDFVLAEDVFLLMIVAPTTHPKPIRDRWLHLTLVGLRFS